MCIRSIRQIIRTWFFEFYLVSFFILDNYSTHNLVVEKQYLGLILHSPGKRGSLQFQIVDCGSIVSV